MRRLSLSILAASLVPLAASAAPQPDVAGHLARDWFSRDMKLGCLGPKADRIPCKSTEDTTFHVYYSADRTKALAVVEYLADETGNAGSTAAVAITEAPETGGWTVGTPMYGLRGQEPTSVKFTGPKVSFVLRTMRPGDPRCCPTGSKSYSMSLR